MVNNKKASPGGIEFLCGCAILTIEEENDLTFREKDERFSEVSEGRKVAPGRRPLRVGPENP